MVCPGSGLCEPWCQSRLGRQLRGLTPLAGVRVTQRLPPSRSGAWAGTSHDRWTECLHVASSHGQGSPIPSQTHLHRLLSELQGTLPEHGTQQRGLSGPHLESHVASLPPDSIGQRSHKFRFEGWDPRTPPVLSGGWHRIGDRILKQPQAASP